MTIGIPLSHRIYYSIISLAALLVALLGLFNPAGLASILPWATVPPLHARFIGSIYAFGAMFLFACTISRQQANVRWASTYDRNLDRPVRVYLCFSFECF